MAANIFLPIDMLSGSVNPREEEANVCLVIIRFHFRDVMWILRATNPSFWFICTSTNFICSLWFC
ncbi:hypothetical protein PHET_11050 [Paragonimus heterotremus]|uniref:Uncharacterized protein n=1 Tax=Paragonimus heterotremus TaxID=100268 RepID=A0A8J4T9H1_9TREM|nr:hypothetical protein PHET_11050 [Paragonimus heterotremus]